MTEYKKITLGQFIDNIEKNGFEQAYGDLFFGEDENALPAWNIGTWEPNVKIHSACALGQALINGGIKNTNPHSSERDTGTDTYYELPPEILEKEDLFSNFCDYVVAMNDNAKNTLAEIAAQARNEFANNLDTEFEFEVFDYSPYIEAK